MSAVPSASLYMTLLSVLLSVSAGQTIIRAVPGQTVSLPCKALNNDPVIVVDWRRTDMKEDEYVLLYRDDQLDPENQHQSYQNRVDLQDRQMKDGDVSLSLNNVKTEDSGTYECSVETKTNRRKRDAGPTVIKLNVVPEKKTKPAEPGQTVSLPCKALNNETVLDVEWRRTDLKEDEYVLLYRDDQLDTTHQHPSYKNRVDLQDRQMKDGDVSLILNNVKIEDSGTYECSVVQNKTNQKRSIIRLEVVPPVSQLSSVEGYKGDQSVLLPCESQTSDLDHPTVEWIRYDLSPSTVHQRQTEGDDLKNQNQLYSNRTSMKTDALTTGDLSLNLRNLQPSDSGTYTCSITDFRTGYQRLRDVHLQVKVSQVTSVEGYEGDQSVLLPCESQTSGLDTPTVEWIRSDLSPSTVHQRQTEGDDLKNQNQLYSDRTSMKTDALTTGDLSLNLRNLQPSDSGTYTCSVTDLKVGYQRLRDVHLQVKDRVQVQDVTTPP